MTEHFIDILKDLIHCYEVVNNENNPLNREVKMWRNKFLNTQKHIENKENAARIWNVFMCIPSDGFMGNSDEHNLNIPERHYDNIARSINENK